MVGKVVEKFFDSGGIHGEMRTGLDEASDVGVAGGINVDGESGEWFLEGREEGVVAEVIVGFGLKRRRRR